MTSSNKSAYTGVVVSNPSAANTNVVSGSFSANEKISIGEYTIIARPPMPCTSLRLYLLPGTRSISPNVTTQVFGVMASSISLSTYAVGVTHTGQPGPEIKWIFSESIPRIPFFEIAAVWLPHTSMICISGPS